MQKSSDVSHSPLIVSFHFDYLATKIQLYQVIIKINGHAHCRPKHERLSGCMHDIQCIRTCTRASIIKEIESKPGNLFWWKHHTSSAWEQNVYGCVTVVAASITVSMGCHTLHASDVSMKPSHLEDERKGHVAISGCQGGGRRFATSGICENLTQFTGTAFSRKSCISAALLFCLIVTNYIRDMTTYGDLTISLCVPTESDSMRLKHGTMSAHTRCHCIFFAQIASRKSFTEHITRLKVMGSYWRTYQARAAGRCKSETWLTRSTTTVLSWHLFFH